MPASQAKRKFHRGESTRLNQEEGHDAILQLLNRKVGNWYYSVKPFEATVADWEGVPLIYAPQHIDFACPLRADKDGDLQRYLDEVGGVVVGENTKPAIDYAGHPRLMGKLLLTTATADRLYEAGLINEESRDA
ncbi:MAG: hypothetical protein PHI56_09695, partial [Victivallaceae bacterium]|nr:hypothetical protein [Victivallaceae bacterium]